MKKILKDFKRYLEVDGYPKNTVKNYISRIRKLLKCIPYTDLSQEKIENFIVKLRKDNKSSTVNAYINAISKFQNFLDKPFKKPKRAKEDEKIPEYISLKTLEEIIEMMELDFEGEEYLRNKTLLYFMFYTGLRQKEILSLKRKNIDLKKKTVTVYQSKTYKEKIIPIPNKLVKVSRVYFEKTEEKENAFNLKENTITYLFKKLKPYVKDINLHPHLLRDSYAMHLLKKGIPITYVQKLLGHSSLATTMRYTQATFEDIQEEIDNKL